MTVTGVSSDVPEELCCAADARAFEDFLPLSVLHARVDAIVEGRTSGDRLAAHRAIADRVAANRRLAEALGWTGYTPRRRGSRGGRGPRHHGGSSAERGSGAFGTIAVRHAPVVANPSSDVGWAPRRYRALEAAVRGRVVLFCPTLSVRLVDRLAARLARAALTYAAGR